jgi:hypothetical protein
MRNGGGGGRTIFPHRPDKHNQRDPWATPIVIVPGMPSMDELLPVDPKTGRPVEGLQTDFLGSLDASGTDTTKSSG